MLKSGEELMNGQSAGESEIKVRSEKLVNLTWLINKMTTTKIKTY